MSKKMSKQMKMKKREDKTLAKWRRKRAQTLRQQAENRRKLIAKLDREAAIFATAEFAKLGLFQ
jgi:hypothetical protein